MSYCKSGIQREVRHAVLNAIFNKTHQNLYSILDGFLPYETQSLLIPDRLIDQGVFNQLKEDILCNL